MSKRQFIDLYLSNKKRKLTHKYAIKIIATDNITKKWLVEYNDLSRSWHDWNEVKDLDVFRKFIETELPSRSGDPSYIS